MLDEAARNTLENDVLPILNPAARADVKGVALDYFKGMTGSEEGRSFISKGTKFLEGIISLTTDSNERVVKDALYSLINLSGDQSTCWKILNIENYPKIGIKWLSQALDPDNMLADIHTSLVANLSRPEQCAKKLVEEIAENETVSIEKIVLCLCDLKHNKYAALDFLGPLLSNLTQVASIRKEITNPDRCIMQRLLPFTEYEASWNRRAGVVGAIRNCCFDSSYHEWLLSDQVDILPRLLLPLAGPEEFDDDDMDKLPEDLQYLPPDKTREPMAEIRLMLIETINQLLATKEGRDKIKEKNAYVIMRELHIWETDAANDRAIQNVVDILIGDEPDPGMENLHNVEIPEDVAKKFEAEDKKIQEENDKNMKNK